MNTTTDFVGNTYATDQQESPGFDPVGASRDRAWVTLTKIAGDCASKLAKVGDRVTIVRRDEDVTPAPRKHHGKTGVVFWVGDDKFAGRQYGSDIQQCLSRAMGNNRRAGVRLDDGTKVFVPLPSATK